MSSWRCRCGAQPPFSDSSPSSPTTSPRRIASPGARRSALAAQVPVERLERDPVRGLVVEDDDATPVVGGGAVATARTVPSSGARIGSPAGRNTSTPRWQRPPLTRQLGLECGGRVRRGAPRRSGRCGMRRGRRRVRAEKSMTGASSSARRHTGPGSAVGEVPPHRAGARDRLDSRRPSRRRNCASSAGSGRDGGAAR